MKELSLDKCVKWLAFFLFFGLLQNCSQRSSFEKLVGHSAIESHVDSGFRYRRESYVFLKNDGAGNMFDYMCSKVSSEFSDANIYNPGVMKFEINKLGSVPNVDKYFHDKYSQGIVRYFSLNSKDGLSQVNIYESDGYVCVLLADGS